MKAKNESPVQTINEQKITSVEIAEISGKMHKHILDSIRNQEIAWEKVNGTKFRLVNYKDAKGETRPMYELTQAESLYIASKFNDEIRAKLVHRWLELETGSQKPKQISQTAAYQENSFITKKMGDRQNTVYFTEGVLWAKLSPIIKFLFNDYSSVNTAMIEKVGLQHFRKFAIGTQQVWFVNIEGFDGFLNLRKEKFPITG